MAFQVTEVQKALKGINYPATAEDLAETAKGNGADDELIEQLRGLSREEFTGPDTVMAELKGSLGND